MPKQDNDDVINYEQTKEQKLNEGPVPEPRPSQGAQETAGRIPSQDELASDSNIPAERLRGSLHGKWEKERSE